MTGLKSSRFAEVSSGAWCEIWHHNHILGGRNQYAYVHIVAQLVSVCTPRSHKQHGNSFGQPTVVTVGEEGNDREWRKGTSS
jgi:hypothetical protein